MQIPNILSMTRFKRAVHPHLPLITRILLISSFIEAASQTLLDYRHHVAFLANVHGIPPPLALFFIAISTTTSFLASVMLFLKPLEKRGIIFLLACLTYQHIMYATNAYYSFFSISTKITGTTIAMTIIRDLSLAFTLLLLNTQSQSQSKSKQSTLLPSFTSFIIPSKMKDCVALACRALLALLAIRISWIVAPIALALLFGFMTDIVGVALLSFFTVVAFTSHQFWLVDSSAHAFAAFERHAIRFEFVHTVSIMSGLLLLFTTGPGALSLDKRWNRQSIQILH